MRQSGRERGKSKHPERKKKRGRGKITGCTQIIDSSLSSVAVVQYLLRSTSSTITKWIFVLKYTGTDPIGQTIGQWPEMISIMVVLEIGWWIIFHESCLRSLLPPEYGSSPFNWCVYPTCYLDLLHPFLGVVWGQGFGTIDDVCRILYSWQSSLAHTYGVTSVKSTINFDQNVCRQATCIMSPSFDS